MAKVHQIYDELRQIEDISVDRAMTAALPTADRLALRLMALVLLHRRHPEGLLGLILHFHVLSPDIQHTVAHHADQMFRSLRQAAEMSHTHGPLNAIQIVHRSLSARLAYLAADQLRHGSSEAQCAAGACLLHLARHGASDPRPGVTPQITPGDLDYLQPAINEAADAFRRHEQRSVLVAGAWLLIRGSPKLHEILSQPRHAATRAMQGLLEEAEQPAILRSLPLLLAVPALSEAAGKGLQRAANQNALGPMLGQYHIMSLPELTRPMQQFEAPGALCLDEAQARALPPHEVRGLPVWIDVLPLERGEKIAHLTRLRRLPDPATRLMALRRLIKLAEANREDGVLDAIAAYCDDPDPQFARIALRCLVRQQYGELTRLLMRLINSPHESVRAFATQRLAPIGFQRLWDAWPKLDERRRHAAGRALVKIDPHFHHTLGEKLNANERPTKLRALNIIAALHQGSAFESTLRQLVAGPDEVLASAAAKALGSARSKAAMQSLEKAMSHADNRVRANAVEAMSQAKSTRQVKQLARMADDDANRPRANAIGALLDMKAGEALPALTRMLGDDRPEHRTSALWLVEHMGVIEAARTIAEMASTDPDPNVQQRADQVARELLESMAVPLPKETTAHAPA